jgi:hypothetical protein
MTDDTEGGARPVVPARITLALDLRGLHGPGVDQAVGTWEGNPTGDVDDWEAGRATPSHAQVRQLAELTRLPAAFFHEPIAPAELGAVVYVCGRSGPSGGGRRVCHRLDVVPQDQARGDRQNALF